MAKCGVRVDKSKGNERKASDEVTLTYPSCRNHVIKYTDPNARRLGGELKLEESSSESIERSLEVLEEKASTD